MAHKLFTLIRDRQLSLVSNNLIVEQKKNRDISLAAKFNDLNWLQNLIGYKFKST